MIILNKEQVEKLKKQFRELRLPGMANTLIMLHETGELHTISAGDLIVRLTEEELINRKNNTIERYLKRAKLSQPYASLELIDYSPERKINQAIMKQLSDDYYIQQHRNVIIMGACGTGKSYIANALASNACRLGYTAYYCRMFEILEMTNSERLLTGDSQNIIKKLIKPEVLVIDDLMNQRLSEKECIDLFKILEYRTGCKTTIFASQLEPKEWHANLGGNILADSILDRATASAYKLTLSGDSLRQKEKVSL